jgi:hypothetical protein
MVWVVIGVLGVGMVRAQDATPTEEASPLSTCISQMPPDRPMPTGPDAPTIRISEPGNGEWVATDSLAITVQTNNFDVRGENNHWHLRVNGQLYGHVYQPTAIIALEPGVYTICASVGTNEHNDMGMPDGIRVVVDAPQAGVPTPTLPVPLEQGQVLAEHSAAPETGQMVLLVVGGLGAAVAGWWLGSRMPKRRKG